MADRILLTVDDRSRLEDTLFMIGHPRAALDASAYLRLTQEIERARVIATEDVPPEVVTMNSVIQIRDQETGERTRVTLSWPEEADAQRNCVSVLAPLGLALLGAREGAHRIWRMPSGNRRLHVEKVLFQPEASGRSTPGPSFEANRNAAPEPVAAESG